MSIETTIEAFAASLADPAALPPAATRGRLGVPDARRFSVYRNNVAIGLIGALETRFPVSRRIAGAEFFRATARAFVSVHKPRSPVMIAYGDEFPDFAGAHMAAVEPAPDLPDLVDVMRLENAWVEAYHAEDAPVATIADLGALDAVALPRALVGFHPAARLLRFSTAAASIWASHQSGAAPVRAAAQIGEDVLIARPDAQVNVRILPPGGYDFAVRLRCGATLLEAAQAAHDPDFDFGTHLVGLVASGAISALVPGGSC